MKKLENDWKYKTLEGLEKEIWPEPTYNSHLVMRTTALRKIPLDQFSVEDLRIMIGQKFSLDHLVPLAIEALSADLFAEGDLYEGDLLESVLKINTAFWKANPRYWQLVNDLLKENYDEVEERKIDVSAFNNSSITG